MKLKAPLALKFKKLLVYPCRKIFQQAINFRFKKPPFIRTLQSHRLHQSKSRSSPPRELANSLLSLFGSLRRKRKMDRLMTLKSLSDAGHQKAPFPSPLTPAYGRMSEGHKREVYRQGDVEDACRSFENYLVEMIVDEGRVGDLMDVEELLRCWKDLKCPVFIDLVCRFYGELCKDLFSNSEEYMDTP